MVFPIADDNSDRALFPYETIGLIVMNFLVFILLQGAGANMKFTYAWSTVPAEILSGEDKVTEPRQVQVQTPEGVQPFTIPGLQPTPVSVYLTLLTSMFMHGGWMHLLSNMWFLWIFGDNIENDLGRVRYLPFYLLCGVGASLAHVFVSSSGESAMVPSLGASGAISGIMGAYLIMHAKRRVTVIMFRFITHVDGWVAVGMWFLLQVVLSIFDRGGGVAYGAHIGGFLVGVALIKPMMIGRQPAKLERVHSRSYFDA